jgi:anti-sigma regulatory factor (Ser/Thr protein kinase)
MKAFDVGRNFDGGLADLDRVHAWLDELPARQPELDASTWSRIRLAVAEAFTNAILHGHGGQPGPKVGVRISSRGDELIRIDVSDCGPGFRLQAPLPPNDQAERGRGLGILHNLAERVVYEANTLSVWVRLKRSARS